jgi:hypothetical protein
MTPSPQSDDQIRRQNARAARKLAELARTEPELDTVILLLLAEDAILAATPENGPPGGL